MCRPQPSGAALEVIFQIGVPGNGSDALDGLRGEGSATEVGVHDDTGSVDEGSERWRQRHLQPGLQLFFDLMGDRFAVIHIDRPVCKAFAK